MPSSVVALTVAVAVSAVVVSVAVADNGVVSSSRFAVAKVGGAETGAATPNCTSRNDSGTIVVSMSSRKIFSIEPSIFSRVSVQSIVGQNARSQLGATEASFDPALNILDL